MTDQQYYAKTWLNRIYVVTKRELAAKEEIQAKLLASVTSGAVDYSKDRIQHNDPKAIEQRMASYAMATNDVEKVREKIAKLIRSRLEAINKVQDSVLRTILIERYINQKSWGRIEKITTYGHSRLHELHLTALDEISRFIPIGEENDET
jgi:hypothetical protein